MEATQVIHTNGDVENTLTLNSEESTAVLDRLDPNIRTVVENQLRQQVAVYTQITDEEFERLLDDAVNISPQSVTTAGNMFPEDSTPISHEETDGTIHENFDAVSPVEYEDISESSDNSVPTVPELPEPIEFSQLNTNFVSETNSRFSGAEWYDTICNTQVTLAGCGGIGSWLALLLSRTNVLSLTLYDDDKVETCNLSGQLFSTHDVGNSKVYSIASTIHRYSNYFRIVSRLYRFDNSCRTTDVMMCGFDNMEARKTYFLAWKNHLITSNKSKCLLVDGRLSVECLQVYCIQGDDDSAIQYYEEHCLFSDEEADATVCSYKQTSFMANMIAGMMVNVFVNWCANLAGGFRPVPIFTEYDAVTMQMKIKMNAND